MPLLRNPLCRTKRVGQTIRGPNRGTEGFRQGSALFYLGIVLCPEGFCAPRVPGGRRFQIPSGSMTRPRRIRIRKFDRVAAWTP